MEGIYDIAIWEVDADAWKGSLGDALEPRKIWGSKHPYIPRKDEQVQIDHNLYKIVRVTYDLGDDHIRLLVVQVK